MFFAVIWRPISGPNLSQRKNSLCGIQSYGIMQTWYTGTNILEEHVAFFCCKHEVILFVQNMDTSVPDM